MGSIMNNTVVVSALGYGVAAVVTALVAWLVAWIRSKMPAQVVERLWDYMYPIAGDLWAEARQKAQSGQADGSWKKQVVNIAMAQLEEEWRKHEDECLTLGELAAAREEFGRTVDRAAGYEV